MSNKHDDTLYFAYGSNLNIEQMSLRCPTAEPVDTLTVKDWRLVFRGVADIVPAKGHTLQGALWRTTKEDERALDRYEGLAHGLYRKVLFQVAGSQQLAYVYLMNDDTIQLPMPYYFNTIRQGYEDWGLDPVTLEEAYLHAGEQGSVRHRGHHRAQESSRRAA